MLFCLTYSNKIHLRSAGATHPSFSDVFLILPPFVNRLTGLRVDSGRVVQLCVRSSAQFLNGDMKSIKEGAKTVKGDGRGARMPGGTFIYHEL